MRREMLPWVSYTGASSVSVDVACARACVRDGVAIRVPECEASATVLRLAQYYRLTRVLLPFE